MNVSVACSSPLGQYLKYQPDRSLGLRKAVAIPSISADEERRKDVVKVGVARS